MQIDHINHVRHDNRIENLRVVSNKENHKNISLSVKSESGVTGVTWHKDRCKWIVRIKDDKKYLYLGLFDNLEDAKRVRKDAEKKLKYHKNHGA